MTYFKSLRVQDLLRLFVEQSAERSIELDILALFVAKIIWTCTVSILGLFSLLCFWMLSIAKNPPQKFDKWQIFPQSSFVSNSTWYKALREDFHNFPNGVKSESLQVTVKRETPWYSLHVKNMIGGSWLAVSFSSHDQKCDTRHFIGSCFFDQLENENLFPAFSVCL